MEEEKTEIDPSIPNRFIGNLSLSGLAAIFYSGSGLMQDNAFHGPNKTYLTYKLLGEPTSLTSAPLVFVASNCVNIMLIAAESFSSKRENIKEFFHSLQYIAPLLVVLTYCLVEAKMGGVTTPDIGRDSLCGDMISGAVGGTCSLLVTLLADRVSKSGNKG